MLTLSVQELIQDLQTLINIDPTIADWPVFTIDSDYEGKEARLLGVTNPINDKSDKRILI